MEKLEKEHAALTVAHDASSSENVKLLADQKSMSENLALANKVRNRTEEKLVDLQKQYNTLKTGFNECDRLMVTFRKKYEEEQKKLTISEQHNDELRIQKKSLEKQHEIQRKQMNDKIVQQNEQIAAEKDTREVWVNRYELEQKKHIATHTDLMNREANFQEIQLKFKNQSTVVDNLEKNRDDLQNQVEAFLAKQTELISENEQMKRELNTQERLNE